MLDVFTGAEFRPRGAYHIKEMVEYCKNREYTHLIVVGEYKRELRTW
jgi:rRNA maturation protein Rpf1